MIYMDMEGTKWVLFQVSVDLFAAKGYANVSIRDIAHAAGIKSASIYHHFTSKEQILNKIYEFYDYNYNKNLKPFEEILAYIEKESPKQVLYRNFFSWGPDMQEIMEKVFMIISIEAFCGDTAAEDIIYKNVFRTTAERISSILKKMIEIKKIKPLDVDGFVLLLSSLFHSTSLSMRSGHPTPMNEFLQATELLFMLVEEIGAGDRT